LRWIIKNKEIKIDYVDIGTLQPNEYNPKKMNKLVLINNKELYDFDYNFIQRIMQEQTNKALEIIC